MSASNIRAVIGAYDDFIIKAYARIRFQIIRQRFLEEIGQYLPEKGQILDVGCGFGLFSLYYALGNPALAFTALDYNTRRIDKAQRAARKLDLQNVDYRVGDARSLILEQQFDAAYMLDIVHHVPPEAVPPLLQTIHRSLASGGVLLVKDVADRPAFKRWFTWWLDKLMDWRTPVHYWPAAELKRVLEQVGFTVHVHHMIDILPYPHVLFICRKKEK